MAEIKEVSTGEAMRRLRQKVDDYNGNGANLADKAAARDQFLVLAHEVWREVTKPRGVRCHKGNFDEEVQGMIHGVGVKEGKIILPA